MKEILLAAMTFGGIVFGVPLIGALLFKPLVEKTYYAEIQANREEEENGGGNFG